MEYIKAKVYELLINLKLKEKSKFEYSILTGNGFKEEYVKPNTLNRVTVYFGNEYCYPQNRWRKKHMTFRNIKRAYRHFKKEE